MSDFTGLKSRAASPCRRHRLGRGAHRLEPRRRPEPGCVAFVESAEDVAASVRFAAANGLRVAGQGTGHGAVAAEAAGRTILIKTERMRGIEIDPSGPRGSRPASCARAERGRRQHGLSSMPGSSPDVGVIGYTLGGGLSWLGRRTASPATGSPRSSWSPPTASSHGRRRERRRPVLGPARRWRRLRDRHRPAPRPAADRRRLRRDLIFPAELGADAFRAYRDWAAGVGEEVTSIARC